MDHGPNPAWWLLLCGLWAKMVFTFLKGFLLLFLRMYNGDYLWPTEPKHIYCLASTGKICDPYCRRSGLLSSYKLYWILFWQTVNFASGSLWSCGGLVLAFVRVGLFQLCSHLWHGLSRVWNTWLECSSMCLFSEWDWTLFLQTCATSEIFV